MKIKLIMSLTALSLAMPFSAHAELLNFFLSDGIRSFSFDLDSNPTPSARSPNSFQTANFQAGSSADGVFLADSFFYTATDLGGIDIADLAGNELVISQTGPQIFAGSTANPMFVTGTYHLADSVENTRYNTNFRLVITTVPLPASVALVGLGLFGMGTLRVARLRH